MLTDIRHSGVEEGGMGGGRGPSSCDLKGVQPPTLQIFLEIRAYKNQYSVVKGCFTLIEKPLFHKK